MEHVEIVYIFHRRLLLLKGSICTLLPLACSTDSAYESLANVQKIPRLEFIRNRISRGDVGRRPCLKPLEANRANRLVRFLTDWIYVRYRLLHAYPAHKWGTFARDGNTTCATVSGNLYHKSYKKTILQYAW